MNPLMKFGIAGHVKLYRSSGGKRGAEVTGMPVLLLTTTGRKSGKPRTVPLVYTEKDGIRYIAGSYGGNPKHPAWFLNLRENPNVKVQVGADEQDIVAEILPSDERAAIWPMFLETSQFVGYEKKTTREIPVIRLASK